jgi:chromatin remodeling complex protein RSC6
MPRKSTVSRKTETTETNSVTPETTETSSVALETNSVVSETTQPVVTKVKKTKTKTSKKEKKEKKEDEDDNDDVVSDVETTTLKNGKKIRKVPTRDSVVVTFDELIASIETEISHLRETPQNKTKGVKFLRSLGKRLKTLRGQTTRVMKQRVRTPRKNNVNSGFLKQVPFSKDLAKFTGWDPELPRSRCDVTKYLCEYIREHNLQNPEDKRQILADTKLSKLLAFDPKKSTVPLTYPHMQKLLVPHFTKAQTTA